ncbi:MAG: sulfatase [Cyclobacteriaceae bacterium]
MLIPRYLALGITYLIIFAFPSCNIKKESALPSRPNIVFIIADDVNWNDLGAYGNPNIKTPNIDQLAKDGMRFTQAFLTTSSCSPSRTSIISGKYPHNTDAEQLGWPLPEDKKTFVEQLKNSGYWTGLAGKYHMGDAVYDDFDSVLEMKWKDAPNGLDRRLVGDGSGCDEWIDLLRSRDKDKPFFTWLASFDAHRPFYKGTIDIPHKPEDVILPPYFPDTDSVRKDFALYYDEISRMDQYIGDVIAELEKQGVADNTLILFITDNGRAFPRDKTTLYEGGIKTPWIVKWPSQVKAGSVNHHMVSSIDIAPTFMKLAGLEPLSDFEGLDFTPLLSENGNPIRDQIYAEDHFHDFEDYTRAIRTKQFKYIKNFYPDLPNTPSADVIRDLTWKSMLQQKASLNKAQLRCFEIPRPKEELYDIAEDPNEFNNLALNVDYYDVLLDMRARLTRMREITKDSLPKARTPDDFFRETGYPTKYRIRPRPSKATYMQALKKGEVLVNPDFEK